MLSTDTSSQYSFFSPQWPDDAWHKNVEKLGGKYERREGEDNQDFVMAFRSRAGGTERQSQGGQVGTKIRTDCTEHFSSAESPLLSSLPWCSHTHHSPLCWQESSLFQRHQVEVSGLRAYCYEPNTWFYELLFCERIHCGAWSFGQLIDNGCSGILIFLSRLKRNVMLFSLSWQSIKNK